MSQPVAPTVVLVHGAFTDASSFAAVAPELVADGQRVVAPTLPNRGLLSDAAHLSSVVRGIPGPVVLAAHSYGGAVAGVAGMEENVAALVYLSAFALDEGENLSGLLSGFPDSDLISAMVYTPSAAAGSNDAGSNDAGSNDGDTDVTVDVEKFPAVVAADMIPDIARIFAENQRPLAAAAFSDQAPAAAWKHKPSWGLVARQDHTINPDVERFGYRRGAMTTSEIDSSHMVILSHPETATALISEAVRTVAQP
jgi:pimeloyl-ACP methyl ester carboxylesterase